MKAFLWFVTGIVGGLALGHVIANDPRGRAVLDELDAGARAFAAGVKDGYTREDSRNGRDD